MFYKIFDFLAEELKRVQENFRRSAEKASLTFEMFERLEEDSGKDFVSILS